jgi:hypothetical protein
LDHSYFRSKGKFFTIHALRIFEIFSAFICSSVFSSVEEVLVGLGVLRNLIVSSAHHCAREIIVTHGKSRLPAFDIFQAIIHINNKPKNQILYNIFMCQRTSNKQQFKIIKFF